MTASTTAPLAATHFSIAVRSTTRVPGWPSFTETVSPDAVELIEDRSHGMVRTEVRCARCGSHLGHVFEDGPREAGGQRWYMNSVALDLKPSWLYS